MHSRVLLSAAAILLLLAVPVTPLGCLNEQGQPVDWFAILKHSGTIESYLYADATSGSAGFQESALDMNSGAVKLTLTAALQEQVFMYNDQLPPSVGADGGSKFGHTKGAVGISQDGSTGFWLIHSAPKGFSLNEDGTLADYPSNAIKFGQSFLCISLDSANLNKVGFAFELNRPQLYNVPSFTQATEAAIPKLVEVVSQGKWTSEGKAKVQTITSIGGQKFKVFAKSKAWGQDLYALVASEYNADVWAETWQNSNKVDLPNYCAQTGSHGPHNVFNIKEYTVAGYTMYQNKDHTKLAIVPEDNVLCIGDINRQSTQFARGGGTACFVNKVLVGQINSELYAYGVSDHVTKGQCADAEDSDL